MIENRGQDIDRIFIEPPEATVLTDEDSADEDTGGLIDNLTGGQLRAGAHVIFADKSTEGIIANDDCDDNVESQSTSIDNDQSDTDVEDQRTVAPPSRKCKRTRTSMDEARNRPTSTSDYKKKCPKQPTIKRKLSKKTSKPTSIWTQDDLPTSDSIFPEADFTAVRSLSPVELFELMFTYEIWNMMITECTRYALFINCADPKVTIEEMKIFISILIVSGYNVLPGKRFYWESSPDVRNELIYQSMRRDRFIQIMRFLHFADNTQPDTSDKMWKLRPLMNVMKNNFLKQFRPTQQLDYDESMVPYYGRHSCKQFIRGKPIRFGYKVWCLNTSTGYLVNCEVYQGKNPNANLEYEESFGKCAAPLIQMIDEFPLHIQELTFNFYFDNLFTGINLLKELKKRDYGATGTMRENRIPKDCPVTLKKTLIKQPRGFVEYANNPDDGIIIARWVDNSVVTMASTIHGMMPASSVQRYSQAEKKLVTVSRPCLFTAYNQGMGGTDRMDENISLYRIAIRGKKWWWPIFAWILDTAIHNAWILAKGAGSTIPQLEFRRQVAQTYLQRYGTMPKSAGRPSTSKASSQRDSRVSDDIRFDGRDHLVIATADGKRRRCAGGDCLSVVRTECEKCGVGLCIPCFVKFHTQ